MPAQEPPKEDLPTLPETMPASHQTKYLTAFSTVSAKSGRSMERAAERQRLRGGLKRRLEPDPRLLAGHFARHRTRFAHPEVQLDMSDYKSNVALYPTFQEYFRKHKPRLLAVWGKNDPFFLPPGAEAFRRDIPDADVRFFDTGHFALETHAKEIGAAIREFLAR